MKHRIDPIHKPRSFAEENPTCHALFKGYRLAEGAMDTWQAGPLPEDDQRRYRVYSFSVGYFMRLLQSMNGQTLLRADGVPEGCRVIGVNFDPLTREWLMGVWHPSFEIVPEQSEATRRTLDITATILPVEVAR